MRANVKQIINLRFKKIMLLGAKFQFECSSCKKIFGSHQALGGHKVSHKNVKGCFAIKRIKEVMAMRLRIRAAMMMA